MVNFQGKFPSPPSSPLWEKGKGEGARLTIFVCCYNAGDFLKGCLNSLARQSIPSSFYKVLFIDDASVDDSRKIAKAYSKRVENFTLLNNEGNLGLVSCCNNGLSAVDTAYFMRVDADDYLSFDAVEKILKELNSQAGEDFIVFKRWEAWNNRVQKIQVDNDIYTWIAAGTVFDTSIVRSVGGYSDEHWEEYDLYVKLLEAGKRFRISPYRIYYYRRGHHSMTEDSEKNKKGLESLLGKWKVEVLKKYGDFGSILESHKT